MMEATLDVITVGNALIDAFLAIQQDNRFTRIAKDTHELCFQYGEKIHVDDCQFLLGGNACNVAVGLSRLGLSTALFAEIGDDEFSQTIIRLLSKESLNHSFVQQTKGQPSSFSVGINYQGERTLFVDHRQRKHVFDLQAVEAKWVYLTSLGIEWKDAYANVLRFAKQKNVKIAFSPGTHQFEAGPMALQEVLQSTYALFVNRQEAARLLEVEENESIGLLLHKLKSLGIALVSITDGANGSYVIDVNGNTFSLGLLPVQVVEKTGAGDAYAAGFLAALLANTSIEDAMRWGAVNAAAVVGKVGAQPGLLSKEEIEKKLAELKDFEVKKLE